MNAVGRQPVPSLSILLRCAVAALAMLLLAACRRPNTLSLRYLPGFVPGSREVFAPATVALAPPGGLAAERRLQVGAVYAADLSVERQLYVQDLGQLLGEALTASLADGGLKPLALGSRPAGNQPPPGGDFLLSCDLRRLEVSKHFGFQRTVHGRYFTMKSVVELDCALFDRAGREVWIGKISGTEDEPPPAVGGEVFLPLETEPEESLSVALSRAVGSILLDPQIRKILPLRAAPPASLKPSP